MTTRLHIFLWQAAWIPGLARHQRFVGCRQADIAGICITAQALQLRLLLIIVAHVFTITLSTSMGFRTFERLASRLDDRRS